MTRTEEIIKYSNSFKGKGMENEELKEIIRLATIDGAMWADANPDEKMIAKYLYEKKGYPIDLNGNLPSFDETMKDAEKYLKYKQDKFIEKACDFFEENIEEEDCKIGSSEWTELRAEYKSLDSFIRSFVKYMKGE